MGAGERGAESCRFLLKGLEQEGSDVNTGAIAAGRTRAGRSTMEHVTLNVSVPSWHLLSLGVTRLYSAEDR